jgi:hypothetical protein
MKDGSDALQQRAQQAAKIIQDPGKYKVCLSCDSIVAAKVTLCPNCHGYRFDPDRDQVVSQARELGQREQHSVIASDLE